MKKPGAHTSTSRPEVVRCHKDCLEARWSFQLTQIRRVIGEYSPEFINIALSLTAYALHLCIREIVLEMLPLSQMSLAPPVTADAKRISGKNSMEATYAV